MTIKVLKTHLNIGVVNWSIKTRQHKLYSPRSRGSSFFSSLSATFKCFRNGGRLGVTDREKGPG